MRFFSGTLLPGNFIVLPVSKKLRAIGFSINSSVILLVLALLISTISFSQNAIVTENALPGNPASEWDISGRADPSIQGFATNLSVNKGEIVNFKIKTDASSYSINIYRIGYYQGNGARFVKKIEINQAQQQPADLYDSQTGKTDCSNWAVSASWDLPVSSVSGVYIAKLIRSNGGANHIIFIVRDDNGSSDLLFKTADATWQAYNNYGGNSFYKGTMYGSGTSIPVPGYSHAPKISYSRPFNNRNGSRDWFTDAEFPMVRFLEKNGYDVSYTTCENMAKDPTAILPSKNRVLISVGHDEYWSAAERQKFENARNAGVHLAFFSGNEVYWKTRWEDNYKTLVCYKEGKAGELTCFAKCDPVENVWTGLWRSGCDYPLADGCKPENALTGQMSWDEAAKPLEVPADYKGLRFWRNTSLTTLADGQTAKMSESTIGFEFDSEQSPETLPKGRMTMSRTDVNGKTHKLSLYKQNSGAWVFGAGTIQWSWGLDEVHTIGNGNPALNYVADIRMQQATVNLFADMGVQPGTIQNNLVVATSSTDIISPVSVITTPDNFTFNIGFPATIKGTASDVGGAVGVVELSTDGGLTWKASNGTANWSYTWTPLVQGSLNVKVRSFDDSGNEEANAIGITVNVSTLPPPAECPCSVFVPSDVPSLIQNDRQSLEIGMKFQASRNGFISGIKFYKSTTGTSNFSGHLWSRTGTLLASVDFTPTTAVGWQEVALPTPVSITAGITYVISVWSASGDYTFTRPYFNNGSISKGPLTALGNLVDGPNGLYIYSTTPAFPNNSYLPTNYWVDVVFEDVQSASLPVVTLEPASVILCSGSPAAFTATATGSPTPTVQWQVSTDNITWTNITTAQTETLAFIPTISDNGKYYRAAFSNAAGTVYTKSVSLKVSFLSTVLASQTNASCVGGDGSITLNATGGITPYNFSIDGGDFQPNSQFSNLNAGMYSFVVKDAIGCSASLPNVIISQNVGVNITLASKKDVTCLGNDGSISFEASNGTLPFSYNLNGSDFQSSNVFSNLIPGEYNIMVKDVNGCSALLGPVTIRNNPSLSILLISKVDVGCLGNDGAIAVGATGGTAPYTYSNNGGTFQPSNVFLNLVPGNYNIIAKDATGCTITLPLIYIELKPQVTLALLSKTDASCSLNDGTIAVTAIGGMAPYTYSKDGVNFQSSSIFNNLAPDAYTITVKDALDCQANLSGVLIENKSILSLTLSGITNTTCGVTDGTFTVAASCGLAPYRYLLSTGIYQTNGTFSNLAAGTYSAYVIDAKSNSALVSGIVISENKTLALIASKIVNEICTYKDGSVTLTATGGKSPYQYRQGTGTYRTGNIFTGLSAGNYSFTVNDNIGCTTTIIATVLSVASNLALVVTDKANASCAGGDGYITVSATGGSGSYTYNINGGAYQTSKTFKFLAEGTYVVSVKDSKGCIISLTGIQVTRTLFIATLASVTNISCKGSDGSIDLSTTGGTSPYLYSVNGGSYNDDKVLSNLKAGTYYVAVKDSRGCIAVVRDIVVAKAAPLTATVVRTNACKNINNGSITVSANGGIPTYQYSLNGGSYKTLNVFSNLAPGTYYVRVKDAKGCLITVSGITITRLTTTCSGRGYDEYVTNAVKANEVVIDKGIEVSGKISIFPNPTSGNFKLSIKNLNGFKANVIIVDALGKEIYKTQTIIRSDFEMLPINLDRIHKGVYFVKLSSTKFSSTEKLIIY